MIRYTFYTIRVAKLENFISIEIEHCQIRMRGCQREVITVNFLENTKEYTSPFPPTFFSEANPNFYSHMSVTHSLRYDNY